MHEDERIDPRDEADLLWLWNDCEGELKRIPSMHQALERRAHFKPIERDQVVDVWNELGQRIGHYGGLRGGPIYVGTVKPGGRPKLDPFASLAGARAVAAATKERRMHEALELAGPGAREVLRLRFREILPAARIPFGVVGGADPKASGALTLIAVRRTLLRGAGSAAHLTRAAIDAHATAVKFGVNLAIGAWVDRLGLTLQRGRATPAERLLGRAIAREVHKLVLAAWKRWRRHAAHQGAHRRGPRTRAA